MPAIKLKKAAAEHQAEKEREEREREAEMPSVKPIKETKEQKDPKEARESKESKEAKDSALLRGLDSNILFEKRKRQIVPSEQKVIDWIDANLEAKENSHVILQHLYDYFAEACSFDGTPVVSMDVFQRRVFDKFGKFFALKESSPYKGVIKERIGKGKGSQVKADSLKLKMKDIIEEGLKEAGNPAKGIRFNSLKQYIACNYPALRIDLRPNLLKSALNKGVAYGYIQLVKGIGMAGFYRLPVDEEPDEEEAKAGEEKGKPEQQNGDSAEGGEKPEEAKKTEEKKKSKKKKEEAKKEEEAKEDKEGETEEGKEGEDEEAKKKKKKKKSRKPRLDSYGVAPKRIEDIFPLAMTYMAEPKQASYQQIKKYIFEHYHNVDENQLRKALVRGTNKGYWAPLNEKSVFSSRYDLLLDEFDPNSTDNVDDMICSAIIACSEPKQASSNLLKKYILEYHPEFNIESRPSLFKMALERGVKKGIIVQISGIGATGSFQLCKAYKPSPVVLAGDEEEVEVDIFKGVKEEVYVPRGTKSRKLVPKTEWSETSYRPSQKRKPPTNRNRPSKPKSSSRAKSSSRKGKVVEEATDDEEQEEEEDLVEEEEEEEDFEPKPKKSKATPKKSKPPKKANAKSSAKKGRKPVSRSQLLEDEEREEPVKEDKRKKSKSEVKDDQEEVKSSRGRSKSRPNYADDEGDSEDDEPKKSRGKKSGGSRRGSRVNYGEGDEDDEEETTTEYTPRKSKSRGGSIDESPSPKKSKKRR